MPDTYTVICTVRTPDASVFFFSLSHFILEQQQKGRRRGGDRQLTICLKILTILLPAVASHASVMSPVLLMQVKKKEEKSAAKMRPNDSLYLSGSCSCCLQAHFTASYEDTRLVNAWISNRDSVFAILPASRPSECFCCFLALCFSGYRRLPKSIAQRSCFEVVGL